MAFGALVLALAATAALSLGGLAKLDANSKELSERDVNALMELVTISEDFLATNGDVLRHLYVEDGFLDARDTTAARIDDWSREAAKALDALEPRLESEEAKATSAEFRAAYAKFQAAAAVRQISAEAERAQTGIGEVAAVAEQSSASAEQISASTQQTSASTQEIAASAQELARTAEHLEQLVSRFRV